MTTRQGIGAKEIGEFLLSLKNLDAISRLKVVNMMDNRLGAKNENMSPVDKLLMASCATLTALNLSGWAHDLVIGLSSSCSTTKQVGAQYRDGG